MAAERFNNSQKRHTLVAPLTRTVMFKATFYGSMKQVAQTPGSDGQNKRGRGTAPRPASQNTAMSQTAPSTQDRSGDESPSNYEYKKTGYSEAYVHEDTGLRVDVSRVGDSSRHRDETHHEPLARTADGTAVHDFGIAPGDICSLSRQDALRMAREFCEARPDGELTGNEEVTL